MSEDSVEKRLDEISPRRRKLLTWLTGGFLSLWGLGFAWVVAAFVKPPRSPRSLAERVLKIGPIDSLPIGKAQLVRHGRDPIFVIRTDEETMVGLSGVCSHLHCVLNWDDQQQVLDCPCHEGAFDVNGNVLKGPPPRPLKRFRVETRLGQIYVHL
ncbi:MAG: Rieske (2Fe-2S) protein [Acidobacteria bacterium]|nr:MAG: Rieske (2Fe-2S) protein [Acidobacteriota bacterium]